MRAEGLLSSRPTAAVWSLSSWEPAQSGGGWVGGRRGPDGEVDRPARAATGVLEGELVGAAVTVAVAGFRSVSWGAVRRSRVERPEMRASRPQPHLVNGGWSRTTRDEWAVWVKVRVRNRVYGGERPYTTKMLMTMTSSSAIRQRWIGRDEVLNRAI